MLSAGLTDNPFTNMDLIVPEWSATANVGAFTTLRCGGTSSAPFDDGAGAGGLNLGSHVGDRVEDVLQNRALLRSMLPAEPAWLSQVHGAAVLDAATLACPVEADASFTAQRAVVCAILTADCL